MSPSQDRVLNVPLQNLERDEPSVVDRAEDLLQGLLKNGRRDATEIRTAAEGASISERTMQRAAEALGVVKTKAGFLGGWTWALPEKAAA
jgi:hypothetical protein